MKIELNRLNDGFWLEAVNEIGNKIHIDASPEIGGTDQGMRPMQLLLSAMGSCSTIDIISILRKQKQNLKDIKITVTGDREKDKVPSLFTNIRVHFRLYGDLDENKVKKAVSLSVEKYCSVVKILERTATITHSFEIIR
jgi:putative redox protein